MINALCGSLSLLVFHEEILGIHVFVDGLTFKIVEVLTPYRPRLADASF